MGISLFLFATVNTEASNIGLNAMVCENFGVFLPIWYLKSTCKTYSGCSFNFLDLSLSLVYCSKASTLTSECAQEYFFQSMFNAVLYGWTPEAFPAPIRGTAAGLASFWGRLFSIVSPLIAADLLQKSVNAPLYLAGSGVFISTIALILMPTKSMGAQSY